MKLKGVISSVGTLTGKLSRGSPNNYLSGVIRFSDTTPVYSGEYEITPTSYEQELETSGLRMRDDVVVHEIPYFETTNPSGGYTVIIGG